MITIENLAMTYGGRILFKDVDLSFTRGNCYGIIGANGSGKSTFLKIISGEIDTGKGNIYIDPKARMSIMKQDQTMYDEYTVLETVIMGNKHLYDIGREKDALYQKPDFSDEDGIKASELEAQYSELGGWESESDASRLLQGLGIATDLYEAYMKDVEGRLKVRILLAQALFGNPDIILLDEPTNNLDLASTVWLEDFLMSCDSTVLVVSHDRYFLNNICTHIVDIDYGKIKMYVGNYDFWYESSQLIQRLTREQNTKTEQKVAALQEFIARFSANRSKSRQATSRRRLLEKISIEEMPASTRRYPWFGLTANRIPGKDRLFVNGVSKTIDGVKLINNVTFAVGKEDKIAFIGDNEIAITTMFKLLSGALEPDEGNIKWGESTTRSYFPKDFNSFFEDSQLNLIDWIAQFSADKRALYLRTFLGRMLFSGDDVNKDVSVLSGGEKVRCMLSKMMLESSNVLMLDQPTNHLDLESIQALNNGLCAFPYNILFYSHDHELTQSAANRIIEITADGIRDERCTFDDYMHETGRDSRASEE